MKYCRNCVLRLMTKLSSAHSAAWQQEPVATGDDSGSIGWAFLGCCIPIVGLILFLVWKDTKPNNARKAGIGALVSSLAICCVLRCNSDHRHRRCICLNQNDGLISGCQSFLAATAAQTGPSPSTAKSFGMRKMHGRADRDGRRCRYFSFVKLTVFQYVILLLPLIIDGFAQLLLPYTSTNFRRCLTGMLFGYALASLFLMSVGYVFNIGYNYGLQLRYAGNH